MEFYDKISKVSDVITARIEPSKDFHEEIYALIKKYDIQYGYIPSVIGMFETCRLGVSNDKMKYIEQDFENVEYSANGNVFQRDGKPFIHIHVTVAGEGNVAYMGHLVSGMTKILCEIVIVKLC